MSLWILDTDHISLFLGGNSSVIAKVNKHSNNIAIAVITVQELFNGWNGKLNDPMPDISSILLDLTALSLP